MGDNADRLIKFHKWWLPMHNIINKKMCSYYQEAMPTVLKKVSITDKTTVLDVGSGTGGLAVIMLEYTSHITGIDFSPVMLKEAIKNYGDKINFIHMAAHEMNQFNDKSFDLVTSAYCLHNMEDEYRLTTLEQMRRVAREKVIIFDLAKNINPIIKAIEFLEGSYYKEYARNIDYQLNSMFPKFEEIQFTKNEMIIYICDV